MTETEITSAEAIAKIIEDLTPYLVASLPILAKIVRKRCIHWRLWPGLLKALGFLIEILDFIHLPKMAPSEQDLSKAEEQARRLANRRRAKRISDEVNRIRQTGEYRKIKSNGC